MRSIALSLSLVLIFMIPWEGMAQLPGIGNATKVSGLAVSAFWLATVLVTGRFRKPSPFHIVVCLFVLWNAVTILWSANPETTLVLVVTWAQLLVLVFILWDLYTTRAALLAGLQAYVLGAYVAVGGALANYISGNPFYTHYQRFAAGDTNPDGFAFIVVLGVPVAWYLAGSKHTSTMSHFLLKWINYAYIPTAFLGLALSGTRTAFIAAMPAMAFGLVSLTRLRLWARIVTCLLLICVLFVMLLTVQPLKSFQRLSTTTTELTEGDLNQRVGLWRDGFASFTEHPLVGVGSNMFRSVNSLGKEAHNSYLSILVEAGLIGFALFAIILAMAIVKAWNHPGWDKSFWLTTLLVWAIGASTLTYEHRKVTWLFLGLVVASAALIRHRYEAALQVQHDPSVGRFSSAG